MEVELTAKEIHIIATALWMLKNEKGRFPNLDPNFDRVWERFNQLSTLVQDGE